jgi:hypothetical protein
MDATLPKHGLRPKRKSGAGEISLETQGTIAPIDAMADCKTFYDERAAIRPAELKRHYIAPAKLLPLPRPARPARVELGQRCR